MKTHDASSTPSQEVNVPAHFAQRLINEQHRLATYIGLLLGKPGLVNDVLQETNLVLWRKASEYDESQDFTSWAFGIARFQVMAHVRDAARDRHMFGEQLMETLAEVAGHKLRRLSQRDIALDECLEKLPRAQRELVRERYIDNQSIAQLASRTGRTATSVAKNLSRIRQTLLTCIQRRISAETKP